MHFLTAPRSPRRPIAAALLAAGLAAFSTSRTRHPSTGAAALRQLRFDDFAGRTLAHVRARRGVDRHRQRRHVAHTVNGDDGNLNYRNGELVSSLLKGTHELELKYRNWGLFDARQLVLRPRGRPEGRAGAEGA